jgi:HEAT repeat protein
MSQNDDERLAQVLGMLTASNTETIRTGEKLLKPISKKATSLMLFMNQLRMNSDAGIRHHAALLLKKKMESHFMKLTPANQHVLRENILPMLRAEPVKVVSVAIAGAVSTLASCTFKDKKQWPELFSNIVQLCQSEREQDRYLCYSLLDQLSEHVADDLHPHTSTLANMFVAGVQDPSPQVAVAAMSAVAVFIAAIGETDEVLLLKPVLPPLLTTLSAFAQSGDTSNFTDGVQVIHQCVQLEQPLINDLIPAIVPFITQILQNDKIENTMRAAAGQALMDVVQGRPKLFSKSNLVSPVISSIAGVLATAELAAGTLFSFGGRIDFDGNNNKDDDDDDDDEEEEDIYKLAQCCLDTMAINIPSKYFLEPALQLCAQGMQSPEVGYRRAGCAMLGIISEGCCDALRPMLGQVIPPLLALTADADPLVREIACFSLGQFSEHCQPEILHLHEQILPAVCKSLEDPKQTVAGTGCYVIEMFVENLSNITLRPFLSPILSRLGVFLQNPKPIIIEMGLAAIGATAVAAEGDFLPYAEVRGCFHLIVVVVVAAVVALYDVWYWRPCPESILDPNLIVLSLFAVDLHVPEAVVVYDGTASA